MQTLSESPVAVSYWKTFTLPLSTDSINAPIGTYADKTSVDLQGCTFIHMAAHGYVAILRDSQYVVKVIRDNPDAVKRELKMMILAGDCAVAPLGRVVHEGALCGIVMRRGTSLVPPSTDPYHVPIIDSALSKDARRNAITQLCTLVTQLHEKGIIHGDIKPSNLLLCSDGRIRLCDFACSCLETEAQVPRAVSTRYLSPFQVKNTPRLSKEDDLYATGVSIWEIYTGRIPFDHIVDEGTVEDQIGAGARPDLNLIKDIDNGNLTIVNLVTRYLDLGNSANRH